MRPAVIGALFAGMGAVALSAAVTTLPRVLLGVALVAAGWAIHRRPDLRGVGGSLVVLGAYLAASGETLLTYGLPALALAALATTGARAWASAAGAVGMLFVIVALTLVEASTVIAVLALVLAVVLAIVVVRAPAEARWGDVAASAGAMAVGLSPFAEVAAGLTDTRLDHGVPALVLVAAVFLLVAVLRRDVAGGILAASVFTTVPLTGPSGTVRAVGVGMVALVIVLAVVAARLPTVRAGITRLIVSARHRGAPAAAACGAVIAIAPVVFVVRTLPLVPVELWVQGLIGLAVLLVCGALAYALPGTAGASAAVAVLVALQLFPVWPRLVLGWDGPHALAGLLTFATAVAASGVFLARHRRVAVCAAATYLLAGSGATFLGAFDVDLALVLPLFVLGVAAAVATRRAGAYGQAAGAVVLALAGFLPLIALVRGVPTSLTPTFVGTTRDTTEVLLLAMVALAVLALVLVTLARPTAALAAGAALTVLAGTRLWVVVATAEGAPSVAWTIVVVALAGVAVTTLPGRFAAAAARAR